MHPKKAIGFICVHLCSAAVFVLGAKGDDVPQAPVPLPADAAAPQWPAPTVPSLGVGLTIRSGNLELVHTREALGSFVLKVDGEPMAIGLNHPQIGWLSDGQLRWLDLANAAHKMLTVSKEKGRIQLKFRGDDSGGATWEIDQLFFGPDLWAGSHPGAIPMEVRIKVNRDRAVAFLPMFVMFPGAGSFGRTKGQGLFAGLEYLDNEPSSSEADVIGPASRRQVPDNLKITFPLMVIQNADLYVALTWKPRPQFSAVFDSPDRHFGSGGHVMGLLFPGSDGRNRVEGSLLPRAAEILRANQPLVLQATLLGGLGKSVVPAIEQYVALRGLPPLPEPRAELQKYAALAAGGWLDSQIRSGNMFRHADLPNFPFGHMADPAVWMAWLASVAEKPDLARRLNDSVKDVLAPIAPADWNSASIGHVHYPVASLLFGHVAENAARADETGHQLLGRFAPDGSVHYSPNPGGVDLARTYFTNEANGFTARPVLDLLEAAAFSGDRELVSASLERLRAMDVFRDGVPRGAQTWEVPLHTPDILASGLMVRAYTLGYELSGDRYFLEQARYWAWTGVPFVYLNDPTDKPVGRYGTIAVYGATQWKAPVWLGLPVQWCGLVYAEGLYRLARNDPDGPWKTLADGITSSGIQQSFPASDAARQGLLPDSFVLRSQQRNEPAINPGTLESCATQLFRRPVYDFQCFRQSGLRVHAPGEFKSATEEAGKVSFEIESWAHRPYFVLINGLTRKPGLKINGTTEEVNGDNQFFEKEGRLVLHLEARTRVEIELTQ